jgi:dienelactone hydrolase
MEESMSLRPLCLGALAGVLLGAPAQAQNFVRMEMIPVPTVTLSTQQILAGETNGKPAIAAGQLRIPKAGTDKLPAIILVHGSGGLSASADEWARELNGIGIAVFVLDSFAGRGIVSTVNDQSQLDHLAMMVDAYRALGVLSGHPRIDPARIAVIGFSKGAVAAVYSSNERFRKQFGPANAAFAAHIGLYTPCNTAYRDDDKVAAKPIRLHHGIPDDWVSIEPCRAYAARLKQAGADVTLSEYPDSYHAYDNPAYATPVKIAQAQTSRNCALAEGDGGKIVNPKTKQDFTLDDPCMERGAQVAYNAAAHKATVAAVKEFLAATFKLKE